MISYEHLESILKERKIGKTDLARGVGLFSRTVAKIAKGEKLSKQTLQRIADYLGVSAELLMVVRSANRILQLLRNEKLAKMPGGLYHELQVMMTFNSNHIEGSKISEEQTRLIFETHTIGFDGSLPVDDILETINHFRAIDYVIDKAEEVLTEDMIKELHYILKHDTQDATRDWFAVGEYKKHANLMIV